MTADIRIPKEPGTTEVDLWEWGMILADPEHPGHIARWGFPPLDHNPAKTMFGEHRIVKIVRRRVTATVTVTEWEDAPEENQPPRTEAEVW